MAAATKVTAGTEPAARSGPSLVVQLGLLVVLTAAAAGMGWFSGGFLVGDRSGADTHAPAGEGHGAKNDGQSEVARGQDSVIALPAITTNIASPPDVWVRMEVSIVLDEPPPSADLANVILQDLISYIRTIKLHEVEGASGFRHLKENLEERAAIRSDGHVRQVLIRTLLFE